MKIYTMLTKPGIILGNAITMFAGFALASKGGIDFIRLLLAVLGLSCVIGSACVFNNLIDRTIDAKMSRTKNRALVLGLVSVQEASFFGLVLGSIGVLILGFFVNLLTLVFAMAGFLIYVFAYSMLKTRTGFSTLIGSVAGATPPLVGCAAASHSIDLGAILLFFIVVFWQMPHFYAIAIYRFDDYMAASIPILPVKKGMRATKIQMLIYTVLYFIASLLPPFFGFAGKFYLAAATFFGFYWLCICIQGFWSVDDTIWAKKIFRFSLILILVISGFISTGY